MAEVVAQGVKVGYSETPWSMADENTGELRSGISNKMKVRLTAPATGTLVVKVPDDLHEDAKAIEKNEPVRLTLDISPKGFVTLTMVEAA